MYIIKNQLWIFCASAMLLTLATGCGETPSDPDDHGHMHADEHEHDHVLAGDDHLHSDQESISLTREQSMNIGIRYGALEERKIKSTIKLSGRVELPPAGKAVAGSTLDGNVTAVHVIAGEQVRKGQRLFTVQNLQIIDWYQELQILDAELEYLESEALRQKTLVNEQITARKKYEAVLVDQKTKQAARRAIVAKLQAVGLDDEGSISAMFPVRAPASGTVQHLLVSNGEYIDAATPMADIINSDHLHVHLLAYGTDIKKLEKGQFVSFFVQSRPEEVLEAKIRWINSVVDEENNSYDVHAEIMDHSGLSAGEYVEARVLNQEANLTTLPSEAVVVDKGLHYIFVRDKVENDEAFFDKVQVQIGEQDLGFVEVLPIDPIPSVGENVVVVSGAFFLMAESKKGEAEAGHHH